MTHCELPAINPPYARTAAGAHLVGVVPDPAKNLNAVLEALVDGSVGLSDVNVFGRKRAIGDFKPEVDPAYRPHASRIVHTSDLNDDELHRLEEALVADHAVISVTVSAAEHARVARILEGCGATNVAFYGRRHHLVATEDE